MAANVSSTMRLIILPFFSGGRLARAVIEFAKCAIYKRFRRMQIRDFSKIGPAG
jgi:hypothetical protein